MAYGRCFQEPLYFLLAAKDNPGAYGNHPAFAAPLYYLGVFKLRRGLEFRFLGTSPFSWFFWYILGEAVNSEQGIFIMLQLIAGKEGNSPISNPIYLLHKFAGVSLGSFANHKGRQHLGYRVKTQPDPGITIMSENLL